MKHNPTRIFLVLYKFINMIFEYRHYLGSADGLLNAICLIALLKIISCISAGVKLIGCFNSKVINLVDGLIVLTK